MKTFSKSDICKSIQVSTGIVYKDVNAIFELLLEQIKTGLFYKNKIHLVNFGTFYIRDYLYKGEQRILIGFKPAVAFKKLIRRRNNREKEKN